MRTTVNVIWLKRLLAVPAALILAVTMFSGCKSAEGSTSGDEYEYYEEWEEGSGGSKKTRATKDSSDSTGEASGSDKENPGSNGNKTTPVKTKKKGTTTTKPKGKNEGAGDLVVEGLGKDSFADYSVKGDVTVSVDTSRPTDYEALFDTFRKLYPNVNLKFDYFMSTNKASAAEYLTTRAAAGKLPDVVFDEAGELPLYVSQGWVYPLDDFVKNDPDFKNIPEGILRSYRYANKLYALPHQAHFNLILLNLDAMETLNIKEPSLSWTVADYEKMLKAGTTARYSGTENLFSLIQFLSGTFSPTKDIGEFGYNQSTRKFEFAKSFNKALDYTWELRTIPGLEAWFMRNSGSSINDSDYAKKFGTDNLSDDTMAFKMGRTLLHPSGTWDYQDFKNTLKFEWEFWPYPQNVAGQMPVHVDHSFMTSTCKNPKAAFALLRYTSYAVEGNIARLSMYDKVNKGKYSLTSPLYYPVTTSSKVADKFNSLPNAGKLEKYLFANIGKCFRGDYKKFVPEFENIHQQYIYDPQCKVTDGIAKAETVMPEAESKANAAMQKAWSDFEAKVKKVQADFKPKH